MHIVFDEIERNTEVSLVSIPKAICRKYRMDVFFVF